VAGFDAASRIPDAAFQQLLQDAWDEGIVTVVAAGNDGPFVTLDHTLPQRLGSDTNG
jgi:dihydrodipicolinate synthase/N-acetylneuraminate lyase